MGLSRVVAPLYIVQTDLLEGLRLARLPLCMASSLLSLAWVSFQHGVWVPERKGVPWDKP